MTDQNSRQQSRFKTYTIYVGLGIVFGPFALVYAGAFLGIGTPSSLPFGVWFMGALTLCGLITFIDFAMSSWRNKRNELGCLIPIGLMTLLWASIFYKDLLKIIG